MGEGEGVISRYQVLEKLGDGGMGSVYKSRDLHLGRIVAIKLLREDKVADPQRQHRFAQEAKAASALNHPNIVTIYDIDQADGVHFIAMEYVPGRTLGEIIAGKGLAPKEALHYAVQIADALAAAHRAGIVHRDLKPANIMIAASGLVKVLDFGLAKLIETAGAPPWEAAATATFKGSTPHTEEGAILGTAAYMSPEQVEGKTADARSDVFSFGAVLYEMLSGRRAFDGGSSISTMAAILNKEPIPLHEIAGGVPRELEKVVGRCLRKDPSRRFQLMEDLKLTLEELQEESGVSSAAAPKARAIVTGIKRRLAFAAIPALLAAAIFAGWRVSRQPSLPAPAQYKLVQITKDSGLTVSPALSPDGKLVAYASDRADKENLDLWLQQVDGGGAVRLTTHPASDHSPVFSPDGTRIAFCSDRDGGGIYIMPALGGDGDARLVVRGGWSPQFSPDGRKIAYYAGTRGSPQGSRIYVVPTEGGPPTQLQPAFTSAAAPVWTPDGNHLMFLGVHPKAGGDLWVTALDGGDPVRTGAFAALSRQRIGIVGLDALSPRGDYLLFSGVLGDSANLWRLPISPGTWRVTGAPERLTFGTAEQAASMAPGGRIAFFSGARTINLWSLPVAAEGGVARGNPEPLTASGAQDTGCDLSANGHLVAFRSNRSGTFRSWVKDLRSGKESALTSDAAFESMPKVSRDGARVAFSRFEDGRRALYVVPATGGLPERVCADCGPPSSWSRDSRRIAYVRIVKPNSEIHLLDLAIGQTRPLLQHPSLPLYGGRFSPDDQWIAFKGDLDARRTVIFVAPVRGDAPPPVEEWISVTGSRAWDDLPRWSPDGNLIYFTSDRDGFRCIWAQRLEPRTKQPQGEPFAVQHLHRMELSMGTLSLAEFELGVARDRLVFPMAELRGNIWLLEPRDSGGRP